MALKDLMGRTPAPAPEPARSSAPSGSWAAEDLFSYDVAPTAGPASPSAGPPTPAPPAADDHFDADALFRDMGR